MAEPAPAASVAPEPAGAVISPALFVSNRDRALHFYVDGLGMMVNATMGPPQKQETILGFSRDPRAAGLMLLCDIIPGAHAPIEHGHGYDRLVLRIVNLDATAARLTAAGFIPSAIRVVAMGYRMMIVTDPDGYRLELVESRKHT